ncbi:MAG: SemiSWEET transporter [Candidatus Pelagibacterales bacterium]|jgi:MtN3 and saliva related transmembrane protein|tara:strand:- start:7942 stop:8202 length:261 start_codon:yes stop_codon:yes gene_type:complete
MNWIHYIGILAGTLTTLAFVPQVIRVWRLKSAKDLSIWWLIIFCTGVSTWLIYGFMINDLPVILANAATIFLLILIIIAKIIYQKN